MRFWDSSAIVPLLVQEEAHARMAELLEQDPEVVIWWGSSVEIASALARCEREHALDADVVRQALGAARTLIGAWHEVFPSDAVRRTAERLLRLHSVRVADSLQLAAALIAADHEPATLDMVCLDKRLGAAAQREGFSVLGGHSN